MKNLLILGGSYFAGRVFIEKLMSREQFNVFVFNRGNVPLNFERVSEIVGDRDNPELIRERIPALNWDVVVDFCAYTPEHVRDLFGNLAGSVDQYILISTTTVYADTDDLPVKESADKVLAPQPELGPYADYGSNKWLAERELAALSREKGFRYTVLRPAIIYGRYNYAPRESYFFDLIAGNRAIVLPDMSLPLFSFLRVDDLASVILRCIDNPKASGEAFNVCGPELISYQRLAQVLETVTGRPLQVRKLSPFEIDNRRIPLPFPLDRHLIYSCEKVREATDFTFTPFADGMRETWQYYQRLSARRK